MPTRPAVLAELDDAKKRHTLALLLAPLDAKKMLDELALSRAIVDVQTSLLTALVDRNALGDEMFNKMVLMLKQLDPHIRRGQKVIQSAKKGHAAVHGTVAEKRRKTKQMLEVCTRIALAHPKWLVTSILEEASSELGCATRTIRRHLPDLKRTLHRT